MHKKILGISVYYHDSAAGLLADGAVVAAAQEDLEAPPVGAKHTKDR